MNQLSFGGGVNSTGVALGMYERGETIDVILMADPGAENPETYRHRDVFSEWLVAHNMPPVLTVQMDWTLEQECLKAHSLPSIVVGIRSCSEKFKIRPQDAFMKTYQPAIEAWDRGEKVTKLIGFDAGEPWRVNDFKSKKYQNRYPLIEWDWAREECIAAIQRHGLEVPPKSSCFFCPEMREWEIVDLSKNHPDLFARAVAMEHNNSAMYAVKGLKRKYTFEQIADYHEKQGTFLNIIQPPRIPCTCYDGE